MIALNYYRSIYMGYAPFHQESLDWSAFADRFAAHAADESALQTTKHEGFLFNMYQFKTEDFVPHKEHPDMGSRCIDNAIGTAALMLDIDDGNTFDEINRVVEEIGVNYVQYSTFSNSATKHKFRLVIELDRSYSPSEIQSRKAGIVALLDSVGFGKVDPASFSVSQAFYLPAYHTGNMHLFQFACKTDGNQLPLESLVEPDPVRVFNEPTEPYVPLDSMTNAVRALLGKLHGIRYGEAMAVANVCKAYNIPCSEFIVIVRGAAARDSSIGTTSNAALEAMYQKSYGKASVDTVVKLIEER